LSRAAAGIATAHPQFPQCLLLTTYSLIHDSSEPPRTARRPTTSYVSRTTTRVQICTPDAGAIRTCSARLRVRKHARAGKSTDHAVERLHLGAIRGPCGVEFIPARPHVSGSGRLALAHRQKSSVRTAGVS